MPKRVLFCATIGDHFRAFHLPYLKWFQERGWEVHAAANGGLDVPYTDRTFDVPIHRTPWRWQNRKAYHELKKIIDANSYDIIHCHTPMGGVLARLAARKARSRGTKVIYTAHGFHFCKGAPLLNWVVYYPIEKLLSPFTDCLITINEEDYLLARRRRFRAQRIERVHGVGVDPEQYKPLDAAARRELRLVHGYQPDDFLMFSAAEFNRNKNQQMLIRALALIRDQAPNMKLLLAGEGPLLQQCRELAVTLGIADRVRFLGYRTDIPSLLPLCDAAVSSSFREGLPVNMMEAMACGLPLVATRNRGHVELIADEVNGYLTGVTDTDTFALRLLELSRSTYLCRKMGLENLNRLQAYSVERVTAELSTIYSRYLSEELDETNREYSRAYL